MPKVVLITYYWPPSASVAMHRWYFMSQHLARNGFDLHVIAPKNANYPTTESDKNDQVDGVSLLRKNIWEVRKIFNKSTKTANTKTDDIFFKDKQELTIKEKLSLWARANIFIPDARIPWYYQIRKSVVEYIKQNKIDVLITTGPPHSIHLNGIYAQTETAVKWIADFRDPWTTIEYHSRMPMTKYAKNQHKHLEKKILTAANHVTTVSPSWAEEFRKIGAQKVDVIYNGFEESIFKGINRTKSTKFIISHLGTLRADRNPDNLWKVLDNMYHVIDFELHLYGEVSDQVKKSIADNSLTEKTRFIGQVSHQDAIKAMFSSDLLLLLVNKDQNNSKGRIPAKIFEYMRSGTKILILEQQEGDASAMSQAYPNMISVKYNNYNQILEAITGLTVSADVSIEEKLVHKFTREQQASNLSTIIQALI